MIFELSHLLVYFACIGLALFLAAIGTVLGLGEPVAKGKVTESSPVEIIKGIGAGYARKLRKYGVKRVADLLAADPKKLGDEIKGISPEQIEKWQEEARKALKGGG